MRRRLLLGAAVAVAAAGERARVAGLFAGRVDDGGFMQAGYEGLLRAGRELGVETRVEQGVAPNPDALAAALRRLAATAPDLVVAHGGQNNAAAQAVATEFPNIRFAVTQGAVSGQNLASYEVLQEQSAFLAGALAALTTRTGTVGHLSGIRVTPGLKGRAAYANGVRHVDPKVRLLTNFSGNQDDRALAKRVAAAMLDQGADVLFTMLNAGRVGATEAVRERSAREIGNVVDWTVRDPVYLGSAVADSGVAFFDAIQDFTTGRFAAGGIRRIGLEQPAAVRLTLAADVPPIVATQLTRLQEEIVSGRLAVETVWSGEEFALD